MSKNTLQKPALNKISPVVSMLQTELSNSNTLTNALKTFGALFKGFGCRKIVVKGIPGYVQTQPGRQCCLCRKPLCLWLLKIELSKTNVCGKCDVNCIKIYTHKAEPINEEGHKPGITN